MIKTTVVIPNYNGREYLEDCLASLYGSEPFGGPEGDPFSVIVVDNGSVDGSVAMVRKKFPQVRMILFEENMGFCRAVNAGILASGTPYVLLLNNDTTVCENFVAHLTEAIEQDERIFAVNPKMVSMSSPELIDDAGDFYCALGWAFARGKGRNEKKYCKRGGIFAACAGASLYRRAVMERIGCFDENHFAYLEDMDIGYRARIYGYSNIYEPAAVVRHAGSGFSGSRYNEFKVRLSSRNSIYLIGKNMPLLQIIINLPFLCAGFLVKYLFFLRKGHGAVYARGLWKGLRLLCSGEGRKHKVPFVWDNIGHYISIQLHLWKNIFLLIFSS